jgi:hypothetical protein
LERSDGHAIYGVIGYEARTSDGVYFGPTLRATYAYQGLTGNPVLIGPDGSVWLATRSDLSEWTVTLGVELALWSPR